MGVSLDEICPDCFEISVRNGVCTSCGWREKDGPRFPNMLPPHFVLKNRYLIGKPLGKGGFGITYKAYDLEYQNICAVKEYLPNFIELKREDSGDLRLLNNGDTGRYQHNRKRFMEEADILYRIHSYPYVVKIRDSFSENNTSYYVMDYINGINLKQVIAGENFIFSVSQATEVMLKVGNTLQVIYEKEGLIHRDISPENILVDRNGEYTLIDFGSAKEIDPKREQGFSVVLKPGFAPLEQYSDTMPQDPYTDVYALAGTFYMMVSGQMLPNALERLNHPEKYHSLCQLGMKVPQKVSDAVDHALAINYKQRTQTIQAFLNELISAGALQVGQQMQNAAQNCIKVEKGRKSDKHQKMQVGYIEIIQGHEKGRKWKIPDDGKMRLVGRDSNRCHIVISYEEVSRLHFEIGFDSLHRRFCGRDNSRNGIFVDGDFYIKSDFFVEPGCLIQFPETDCVLYLGVDHE